MSGHWLRLALVLTWGFTLLAYGRAQRVSGFHDWETCEHVRAAMDAAHPEWRVADRCDLDEAALTGGRPVVYAHLQKEAL